MRSYKIAVAKAPEGDETEETPPVSEEKIKADMRARNIRFDLTREDRYWYRNPEKFWEEFKDTSEIKVPEKFEDWLIGQERVKREARLQLEEWVRKLKDINEMRKKGILVTEILRERPGPYLLMVGAPGTGKSLLTKILAADLERLYSRHGIKLYDMMLVKNRNNKFSPHTRMVPAGLGRRILDVAVHERMVQGQRRGRWIFAGLMAMVLLGLAMMGTAFYNLGVVMSEIGILDGWTKAGAAVLQPWMAIGAIFTIFPLFLILGGRAFGINWRAPTERELLDTPHLLVDNGAGRKLYVNSTITNSGKLFGDLEWSPFGEHPQLATPTHKRVVAGDVHQANMKILYIDELRNMDEKMAVELLTVMEDGTSPVRGHQSWGGTHTASQNVETGPVDAMFFLIASANMDMILDPHSIINTVPAFKDRFNYGNIVMMETEMDATAENEIKVTQVIADELYRFNLLSMEKAGVREIIDFMRRKASSNKKLSITFRSVIKLLKKSAQLAWAENETTIRGDHVRLAIEEHAKPIEQQVMEQQVERQRPYKIIQKEGSKVGVVNGLVVLHDTLSGEGAGDVATVAAWMQKVDDPQRADFVVTGINEDKNTWIADSKRHVRTAIMKMYGVDISRDYYAHITFLQNKGVDGPCLLPGSRVWYNGRPGEVGLGHQRIVSGGGTSQGIISEEWRPYSGNAYAIKPRYLQELKVTPNHPFYVVKLVGKSSRSPLRHGEAKVRWEGWLGAKDLRPGDYLVVPRSIVPGADRPQEILLTPGPSWRNGLGRTRIPLDEKAATFLGWYVAEGCSKENGEITLTLNVEKDPLGQLEEVIRHMGYSPYRQSLQGKAVNLSFKSRMLGRWLRENVGTRATNKRIPGVIFDSPGEIRLAFVRGYISGDGFNGKRILGMKTASKDLWYDLTYLLVSLGIVPSTSSEGPSSHTFQGRLIRGSGSYVVNIYGNQRELIFGGIEKKRHASQFVEQADRFLVPVDRVESFPYEGPIYNVETKDGTYLMPVKTHNSAGITMTLAIMSFLGDPALPADERVPIPLRQDVAVTGGVEIIAADGGGLNRADVVVSPVGGIADKVRGAARWGMKYILIPIENWEHSLDDSDRRNLGVTVVGCRTVQDYLTWVRADGKRPLEMMDDGTE